MQYGHHRACSLMTNGFVGAADSAAERVGTAGAALLTYRTAAVALRATAIAAAAARIFRIMSAALLRRADSLCGRSSAAPAIDSAAIHAPCRCCSTPDPRA